MLKEWYFFCPINMELDDFILQIGVASVPKGLSV